MLRSSRLIIAALATLAVTAPAAVAAASLARAKTAIAHANFTPQARSATVIFNAPSVTHVLSANTQGALDFDLTRTHGHWLITELLS